jgi:hypothetical protein
MYKFTGNNDFGSLSTATMLNSDLIPCFVDEIERLRIANNEPEIPEIEEIKERMEFEDYYESEDADIDLNEVLFEKLNEYAPPFVYFGANEGDGCDFGFWIDYESIMEHFFEDPINKTKVDRKGIIQAGEYLDSDGEYCITVNSWNEFVKLESVKVLDIEPHTEMVGNEMLMIHKKTIKETIWENY